MASWCMEFPLKGLLVEPIFQQLGIAALLGLLVGLQRERSAPGLAGMRTFPLITVLGTVAALLAVEFGGWIVAAGMLAIVAVVAAHLWSVGGADHVVNSGKTVGNGHGTTTDIAMLVMYGVGALLVIAPLSVGVAIGGGVAVLLQFKPELHGFANRLGDPDLRAIMQFVLLTCIVLPVLPQDNLPLLPDPPYGSLNVLNPFEIWLMVVLIVGLSLGGYILYKFAGEGAGVLFSGILGGAVSSTATTISAARQVHGDPLAARSAAIVIMIASTVSLLRVLVAIAIVAPPFVATVAPSVLVLALMTLVPTAVVWLRRHRQSPNTAQHQNPSELKSALVFGAVYAVVLFALAAAKYQFGSQGLYVVAGLSGLTEMDAITLSTARLAMTDPTVAVDGWRMIVVAILANMVSKAVLAGLFGGRRLLWTLALLFLLPLAGGLLLLCL